MVLTKVFREEKEVDCHFMLCMLIYDTSSLLAKRTMATQNKVLFERKGTAISQIICGLLLGLIGTIFAVMPLITKVDG